MPVWHQLVSVLAGAKGELWLVPRCVAQAGEANRATGPLHRLSVKTKTPAQPLQAVQDGTNSPHELQIRPDAKETSTGCQPLLDQATSM